LLDLYNEMDIKDIDRLPFGTKLNILEAKIEDLKKQKQLKNAGDKANKIAEEIMTGKNYDGLLSDDMAIEALTRCNGIMCRFLEITTQTARKNPDIADYIPNVDGLANKIEDPVYDKELRGVFKQIIEQHGESIKPYLNPIARYISVMIFGITATIAENKAKSAQEDITKKKNNHL